MYSMYLKDCHILLYACTCTCMYLKEVAHFWHLSGVSERLEQPPVISIIPFASELTKFSTPKRTATTTPESSTPKTVTTAKVVKRVLSRPAESAAPVAATETVEVSFSRTSREARPTVISSPPPVSFLLRQILPHTLR